MRTWRFITILLAALSMAMAFCYLLELATRMSFDGRLWLTTQALYWLFGPPLGAIIVGGAVMTTMILSFLVRQRRSAFWWTLLGTTSIVVAHVIWWIFINPVNADVSTESPMPYLQTGCDTKIRGNIPMRQERSCRLWGSAR
jgi:hypothetical protein